MAPAEPGAAVAADGVDLVDEDDGRGARLGLLEQVADPGGADPDEHLDEVRTRDREEGHARLTGDRPGEQRLAGAGRAEQEYAFGDLGAHLLELRRALEELLDLLQLFDRLVDARDVVEGDLRLVLGHHLRFGLAEGHDAVASPLHLLHEEEEDPDDDQERQEARQDAHPDRLVLGIDVLGDLGVLGEQVVQPGGRQEGAPELGAVGQRARDGLALMLDHELGDLTVGQLGLEVAVGELLDPDAACDEGCDHPNDRDENEKIEDRAAKELFHGNANLARCQRTHTSENPRRGRGLAPSYLFAIPSASRSAAYPECGGSSRMTATYGRLRYFCR